MFIITKDRITHDEPRATAICGPGNISDADVALLKSIASGKRPSGMKPEHFRVYDDDGEHYFDGYYLDSNGSDEFDVLECFGYSFGCTTIKMRNTDGTYSVL
jgi:hypothetical protein